MKYQRGNEKSEKRIGKIECIIPLKCVPCCCCVDACVMPFSISYFFSFLGHSMNKNKPLDKIAYLLSRSNLWKYSLFFVVVNRVVVEAFNKGFYCHLQMTVQKFMSITKLWQLFIRRSAEVKKITSIQFKSNQKKSSQICCEWHAHKYLSKPCTWFAIRIELKAPLELLWISFVQIECFFGNLFEFNIHCTDSFSIFSRFKCIFMQKMWCKLFARAIFFQFQTKNHE